jgi:AbrB family looped-hinge helix DNA binding protein
MDRAGRVVIPKPIREKAGLRPGEPLEVTYRHGRIEIEPAASEVTLIWKGRLLVARAPGVNPLRPEQVNDVLHEGRVRES